MLDPYMVLGVGKYDDDQTVKKAYRQLSKQYHPDNNLNNPNKEAAEETFKKIQQAYEQIMHERSIGIGGPDDLRRKQNEGSGSSSWNSSQQSANSSWNSRETATKDRYTSGFWNNTWNNNSNSNNNYNSGNKSYSGNNGNGYNSGNSSYTNNNSYTNNSSYSNNNGYNSGNSYYNGSNNTGYNDTYKSSSSGYGSSTNGYYSGTGGYSYTRDNSTNNSAYGNGGNGGYYSGNYTNNQYNSSYGPNVDFNEDVDSILNTVAQKLNGRNFFDAWDILNSMKTRNDVWYYYSAIANLGLGNSITALNHARTAKAMQPARPEYDELINGIQSGTLHYRGKNEMFVPQKGNAGNTCLKIGLAMVFFNVFCGGGGAVCGSIGICC